MPGSSDAVRVIEPGRTYVGKQGFTYGAGVSKETAGAKQVCLNVLPMPPGAKAKVHYHKGIETIAYLLEGECALYYGDKLEHRLVAKAEDQVYMPEDVRKRSVDPLVSCWSRRCEESSGSDGGLG
jgi:uncharacterized RmlC-like cupin family protein